MEIIAKSLSGVPLLEVVGDVDHFVADELDQAARAALNGHHRLFIDLLACPYMDSAGVSVILYLMRGLPSDGWIGMIHCDANLARLFELVGLVGDPGFRLFANDTEAADAAEAAGATDAAASAAATAPAETARRGAA